VLNSGMQERLKLSRRAKIESLISEGENCSIVLRGMDWQNGVEVKGVSQISTNP
jgi:hypothetical protein